MQCTGEERTGAWDSLTCKPGYTGAMCNVCSDGNDDPPLYEPYGKQGQACVKCSELSDSSVFNWKFVVVIVVVVVLMAARGLMKRRQLSTSDSQHALNAPLASQNAAHQDQQVWESLDDFHLGPMEEVVESSSFNSRSNWSTVLAALFQPLRIVIGFAQICSQLGTVLMVTMPPQISSVLEWLKENFFVDLWALFLHFDCLGLRSYYVRWVLHVFIMPLFLMICAAVVYRYQKHRGYLSALNDFKSNVFWVIFLCYPSICTHAFQIYECRQFSVEERLLEADYTVSCKSATHMGFYILGGLVIVFVAIGVPLTVFVYLYHRTQTGSKETKAQHAETAQAVLSELKKFDGKRPIHDDDEHKQPIVAMLAKVELDNVHRLLRDLDLADFSSLIKIYKPEWFLWETFDMARKLVLGQKTSNFP